MDYCSYFIKDKGIFGSYPDENRFKKLVTTLKVSHFIDLTTDHEKHSLYNYDKNNITYINYQIKDRFIPEDIYKFIQFINKLKNIIENDIKDTCIYIHCKGGHGRCGIVVSCLLCYLYKYTSTHSLELTNKYHNERLIMKDKWRKIGSPQTDRQKEFVNRLFKPIYLNNIHVKNTYYPLNNNSFYSILVDNMFYKNINTYYYSMKDKKLYKRLNNSKNFYEFKSIIENISGNNIKGKEEDIMRRAFTIKFENNQLIQDLLKKTLLKPIKYVEDNIDIGILWEEIRHNYFFNI